METYQSVIFAATLSRQIVASHKTSHASRAVLSAQCTLCKGQASVDMPPYWLVPFGRTQFFKQEQEAEA